MADTPDMLTAYMRSTWLLQQVMQCCGVYPPQLLLPQAWDGDAALLPLVVLAAVSARLDVFAAALLGRILLRLARWPLIWESEVWSILIDATLLLSIVRATAGRRHPDSKDGRTQERNAIVLEAASSIREQLVVFYSAAAFWKLNFAFVDHTTSCAPIFVMQLLDAYVPSFLLVPGLVRLVGLLAPAATLVLEAALPMALFLGASPERTRWRRFGVTLALLFHLLIAFTPPPNNAGSFSTAAGKYLFFFVPAAATQVYSSICGAFALGGEGPGNAAAAALALAAVVLAVAIKAAIHELYTDWAVPVFAAQLCVLGPALVLPCSAHQEPAPKTGSSWRVARRVMLGLALAYAYALPALGVMDQMAPNMFANLKLHGGSNHLLLPTGLLHPVLLGHVVRVEDTTSAYLRRRYPAEVTDVLSPRVREMLKSVGHSGRQFNPMLGRVQGLQAVPPPPEDAPFVPYTLPAFEFRRLLSEARAQKEAFSVRYTQLPGRSGDEAWRRSAGRGTAVIYKEDPATGRRICTTEGGEPCAADELALQPPPPSWARKLALFQPYPILTDQEWRQVHCFGP